MLKAVIFDMDGVLIDSEPVHFAANQETMTELFGIELDYDYYKTYIGSTIRKMWQDFKEKYSLEGYEWNELMDISEARLAKIVEKNGYPPIPGAKELVIDLKKRGYLMAVASSSPYATIESNLKSLELLDEFDVIVSGMNVKNPKPSPDIFLETAEMLGVKSEECIVIEDSGNGVKAAKAAGMACLGFINENSGNQDLSVADALFEDFENIDEAYIRMVHNHCNKIP